MDWAIPYLGENMGGKMGEGLVPNQVEELEEQIKTQNKRIKELEGIIMKFKKFFDSWPRFATQLGIKDE